MTKAASLTLGLAASLLIAGCGGGSQSSVTAKEAQTVIEAEDQLRAESIGLTLADFPPGWRATPSTEDDDDDECVSFDFSDLTVSGAAQSDDFSKDDAEVSSGVKVYASEDDASAALTRISSLFKSEELRQCLADLVKKGAEEQEGTTVGEISIGELSFTDLAEETRAWQIEVPFEVQGLSVSAYLDVVGLREERTVTGLTFLNVLERFDQEQEEELASTVSDRMGP